MERLSAKQLLTSSEAFLVRELKRHGHNTAEKILKEYRRPRPVVNEQEFFHRLVYHSFNRNRGPGVIGKILKKREDEFREILCDFHPEQVIKKWSTESELKRELVKRHFFQAAEKDQKWDYWSLFTQSVIDSAAFLAENPLSSFREAVQESELSVIGGIAYIADRIRGYGYALAADVLKESGLVDTIKPDVHIKKTLAELGLRFSNNLSCIVFVNRECRKEGVCCYELDKFLWLIQSSKFYLHEGTVTEKMDNKAWLAQLQRH